MSKTPVLAAVSAALLALAIPTYGTEGVTQRIKDEQYSNFVSGASFCSTGAWASANETWSTSGGLNPRYWSGTDGASVAHIGSRAPDGSYLYLDSWYPWEWMYQPPVYGRVLDDQEYRNLYGNWGVQWHNRDFFLTDIDTSTVAPVVCRFAEEGDVVASDGSDIFFDANVTLEAFAYGEANRPDDSVLAPDAKLAIYIQDIKPTGDPRFFIVSRDWNTGAARHYRVEGEWPWLEGHPEHGGSYPGPYHGYRYSGRIIVRAVRSVHKGKSDPVVPAFLVYALDGTNPLYWDSRGTIGHPPAAGDVQWDKVRDDLGSPPYDGNHLFKPLSPSSDMRLSKVSYGGGVRLGAYAVGTADPMRTTIGWAADSSMIRLLRVDGTEIDGYRWVGPGSERQYQGAEEVDAGSYTYYPKGYKRRSVSWCGVNGWGDGEYVITPGVGCEVELGPSLFQRGRASLDIFEDHEGIDEWVAKLEADGLPHVDSRVPGTGRYTEVTDALVHAAYLGATVKLLAYPMATLVMPPLEYDVTVDLNGHDVPANSRYANALGLTEEPYGAPDWVDSAGLRGGVVAYPAPGKECTFTLNRGSLTSDGGSPTVFGGLSVTGVSLRVSGVQINDFAQICNSPSAILGGYFKDSPYVTTILGGYFNDSLYVTNTALTIIGGRVTGRGTGTTAPAFMTNASLRVDGGSLSMSGGTHGHVACYGVNPVSITGGSLSGLTTYDSSVTALAGDIGSVCISNSPTSLTAYGTTRGLVTLTDIHGDVDVSGHPEGGLDITRAGAVTIRSKEKDLGSTVIRDSSSVVVEAVTRNIRIYDTPVIELRSGECYIPWAEYDGVLEVNGCGSVLLSGYKVSPTPYFAKTSTSTVVLSNCTSVTVTAGDFFGYPQFRGPSNGRFSVSGDSLVVSGGRFYSMDAHEASSVTVSGSPTFYWSASFSAPSVEIRGGTFCDTPYPEGSRDWPVSPTFSIVSTNAVISGGTFNGTLSGSGIVVSGGKFLWGKNPHLDKNGVIVLVAGKKLVKTGPASHIYESPEHQLRNTYWEVHDK